MGALFFLLCVVSTYAALPDLNFEECGFKYKVYNVIGEKSTDHDEYPWTVALYVHRKGVDFPYYRCEGSIIHPRVILTTAHCVYNEKTRDVEDSILSVGAGQYHLFWVYTPLEQKRQVARIFIHPMYGGRRNRYAEDIALLALNYPLLLNTVIMPVCIDWDSKLNLPEADTYGTVVGVGRNRNGSLISELKVETQKYYDTKKCLTSNLVSENFSSLITSDKFCGEANDNTLPISGSGFTIPHNTTDNDQQYYLYGLVSTKDRASNITAYTGVKAHLAWLKETLSSILA